MFGWRLDFFGCFLIETVSECLNLSLRQMVQTSNVTLAWTRCHVLLGVYHPRK